MSPTDCHDVFWDVVLFTGFLYELNNQFTLPLPYDNTCICISCINLSISLTMLCVPLWFGDIIFPYLSRAFWAKIRFKLYMLCHPLTPWLCVCLGGYKLMSNKPSNKLTKILKIPTFPDGTFLPPKIKHNLSEHW